MVPHIDLEHYLLYNCWLTTATLFYECIWVRKNNIICSEAVSRRNRYGIYSICLLSPRVRLSWGSMVCRIPTIPCRRSDSSEATQLSLGISISKHHHLFFFFLSQTYLKAVAWKIFFYEIIVDKTLQRSIDEH